MTLLHIIIHERRPELKALLAKIGEEMLSQEEREELRGAVADELAATGFLGTADSETVGRVLDRLIGRLGDV